MPLILGFGACVGAFGISAINNFGLGHAGRGFMGTLAVSDAIKRVNNLKNSESPLDAAYNGARLLGDGYVAYESVHYFLDLGIDRKKALFAIM